MNTPKNPNALVVLDSLSPSAQQALDRHFENKYRSAILDSITKQLGKKVVIGDSIASDDNADDAPATPAKRGRPKKNPAEPVVQAPAKGKGKRGPGRPKLSAAEKTRRAKERASEAAPKKRGPKAKRGPGSLGLTAKGLTASETIRRFDAKHPDCPAADVVAHCHKLGLKRVTAANVYNCRALVRKSAE